MFLKKFIYWFIKNTTPENPKLYNTRILNKATLILIIHQWGVKVCLLIVTIIPKQCAIYEKDFGAQSPGFEPLLCPLLAVQP